jgi:hypothetical protein
LLGALLEQALDAGVGVVFTSHLSAPLRAARLDVLDLPAAAS